MRSLYARIVVASFITVVVSLALFVAIAQRVVGVSMQRFVEATYAVQLDETLELLRRGDAADVAQFIRRMDAGLGMTHYITDQSGRDVITGADHSRLLSIAPVGGAPRADGDTFVMIRGTADGRFRLIVIGRPPFTMWSFAPFYLLMLVSVALISWWVSRSIVLPIRLIAKTADRFGRGDLAARVVETPPNEIGRLATAFNGMADRVETLLQAERRLLQDVSHELRSPLTRLNFSVELARTASDRAGAIDRIMTDVERLSTLVSELIEMTRAEGDLTARRVQPVAIDELLEDVRVTCAREAEARDTDVVVIGHAEQSVPGDRELLRWSIENVVRNGLHYTPPGTTVEIRAHTTPEAVRVEVRDFGPGVPEAELARIFQSFYRVEASRATATGGLGLGLAIAQRAIRLHQGTVVAANAAPGLRVTITLPVTSSPAL